MRSDHARLPGFAPPPPRVAYQRRLCGFNLIEAAIVLGVVGFVLGGIWVGAVKMREDWQVQKVASDINLAASEIRKLFRGLPLPTGTNFYIQVTPDAKRIDFDKWEIRIPWHETTASYGAISIQLQGTFFHFILTYPRKSICIKLVKAMAPTDNAAREVGLRLEIPSGTGNWHGPTLSYNNTAKSLYDYAQANCLDASSAQAGSIAFSFRPN